MTVARPEAGTSRWAWIDLRLVPAAAAIWAVSLVAPYLGVAPLGTGALVAAALAVVVGSVPRRGTGVALAVLAGIALAAGTGAVRTSVRESSPLRALVESGRTTLMTMHIDSQPYVLAGAGTPRVMVDATVSSFVDGSAAYRLDAAVLVFAPADAWQGLLPGQTVQVRARAAPPRAGDDIVAVLAPRGAPERVGQPGTLQRIAASLRRGLAASAHRVLPDHPAGLLPGLVVGDTTSMDPVLTGKFRRAGLSHLTAVSGANVAIILTGILWPLRRRAVSRRVQALVGLVAIAGFVILAQPGASVLRAAVMGAIVLGALASGRARAAVPALAATVCVLLVFDPRLARDIGFALSVVATAAIVLLGPGWSRRLQERGCPRVLADALAVSAAAGVATAPLVAGLSGTVSLVSLPANLLAAPAVAPATVLGLAATLVAWLLPPLADLLVWLAGWPVRWLVLVAERAASVPDGATAWPAGSAGALLLTGLLLSAVWAVWRYRRVRVLGLAALVGLLVLGWPVRQVVRGWPPMGTVVVACDVGQGDALVVPTGGDAGILIDTGPDVVAVDRCLDRLGIHSLPVVLLSHLDADHAGGLSGALAGRAVGAVATATLSPADDRVGARVRTVRRAGARREVLVPGDRRTVGAATLEVLAPDPHWATVSASPNDLSMVVRITEHGVRTLFTGDLSAEAERRILASGTDLAADVLKVPHHGSADADPDFLAASGARVALISVGADNTYGHPTRRTLTWLAQDAMEIHRTDREGDVAVAGTAASWGVAAAGSTTAAAAPPDPFHGTAMAAAGQARTSARASRKRRYRVAPCRRGGEPGGAHLTAACGDGGGGAAALAGGLRRAVGRARPPP